MRPADPIRYRRDMATPRPSLVRSTAARFAAFASLLPLVALPPGCGKDAPAAPAPELLDRGAEPRASIAFRPRPVPPRSFDLAIEMSSGVLVGQRDTAERRVAPVHVALELRPDPAISGRGEYAEFIVGETTLTEEGADPEVLKNWKEDLKRMTPRGVKGRLEADSRGRVAKVELKMPKPAPNTVRQLLESAQTVFELFCVPRCDEPVGVGAKLRDRREVSLSGMKVDLDATYTLVSIDGERLTFDTAMKIRALPQLIALPSAKDRDSKAEVLSALGEGRGRIVVPLDRIGPIEGTLALPVEMEIRVFHEGKENTMKSAIDLRLSLTPR